MRLMIKAKRATVSVSTLLCGVLVAFASCSHTPKEHPAAADAGSPATSASAEPAKADWGAGPTVFELGPLPPEAPFEGRVTVQVTANDEQAGLGEPASYYFTMKGKKARWDLFDKGGMGAPSGYRVYDADQHTFFTVMRRPTLYTTNEATLIGDAGALKALKLAPFKLEPRGTVQGTACDRVTAQDDAFDYEACLASGLPPVPLHLLGGVIAKVVPFGAELEKRGAFPLNVIIRERKLPDGTTVRPIFAKLTTMRIERGRVPDKAFELPSFPVVETPLLIAPGIAR
jgi:hypothetical protein